MGDEPVALGRVVRKEGVMDRALYVVYLVILLFAVLLGVQLGGWL